MDDLKRYVCGFLFHYGDNNRAIPAQVLLIKKSRPDWQKYYLNGIGGLINSDETPHEAMRREFREETGLDIPNWGFPEKRTYDKAVVWFYSSWVDPIMFMQARTKTDEPLLRLEVAVLNKFPLVRDVENVIQSATAGIFNILA